MAPLAGCRESEAPTPSATPAPQPSAAPSVVSDYDRARWDPIHFKPAIETASDEQCLACHREVLERKPLERSPAGVRAVDVVAWYQTLDTYEGEQETFHRRHLVTPFAQRVMRMRCNTCHLGNDPREEAPFPPSEAPAGFTLRKMVDSSDTCLRCHGQMNYQAMGLPGPWDEVRSSVGDNCLLCHVAIRTNRHRVNYLDANAIEEAGKQGSDSCWGCHGGRAWYRTAFPYPRNAWPGMAEAVPEWAAGRPTQPDARFRE